MPIPKNPIQTMGNNKTIKSNSNNTKKTSAVNEEKQKNTNSNIKSGMVDTANDFNADSDFLKPLEDQRKNSPKKNNVTDKNVHNHRGKNAVDRDANGTIANPDSIDDKYAIDKETGIKYEKLPGSSPEAIKEFQHRGKSLGIEQLRQYTEVVNDFDDLDLNSVAERFLAHLRVAPSKEEIEQMRQERIRRAQKMKNNNNN